jgi:uncharacterized protein YlzI (FlbEa/FlbD family)
VKPIFLVGTQPGGLPVAINVDQVKYVVAFDKALTMIIMVDGEKVAVTESVDDFVTTVNDI